MEYRKFNNVLVIRMDRGEEIMEKLKEVALKENVRLANVNALGAVDEFTVGAYDVLEKKYNSNTFKGVYEIVSLTGSINTMNGEYYSHIHMAAADEKGQTVGGHLNSARISATCEMFIYIIEGKVDRFKDDSTGLNLFKFN
jgi:predicted DNA-binding protein with PD1-like motif